MHVASRVRDQSTDRLKDGDSNISGIHCVITRFHVDDCKHQWHFHYFHESRTELSQSSTQTYQITSCLQPLLFSEGEIWMRSLHMS
jgi:hypothetical protein